MHNDTPLIMLSYTSIASHIMPRDELNALLEQARDNNSQRNITGLLLYMECCFFQVLEGEPAQVEALYRLISQDKRHHHVMKLIEEPIASRSFAHWNMGYQHVSREDLHTISGLTDFLDKPQMGFEGMQSALARKLIDAFRDGRWQTRNTQQYRYISLR